MCVSVVGSRNCREASRVGAVVVSYYPEVNLLLRLLFALAPQVSRIFVIDNGSDEETLAQLAESIDGYNVDLVRLASNQGIAVAHNVGIRHVEELSLEFVALFDQDSIPAPDMIDLLVGSYEALSRNDIPVAAVGPTTVDQRTGTLGKFASIRHGLVHQVSCSADIDFLEADFLVSSGSLIPLSVLENVGGMAEGYFIDHVDTEWCLRARTRGLKLFGVCRAKLMHTLGDEVLSVWWFGRWREVAVHSPLRDYFMCRNTVLLLRNLPMAWSWRLALLVRLFMFVGFFGFGVRPRKKRLRMMLQGFWHGFLGRTGAL